MENEQLRDNRFLEGEIPLLVDSEPLRRIEAHLEPILSGSLRGASMEDSITL